MEGLGNFPLPTPIIYDINEQDIKNGCRDSGQNCPAFHALDRFVNEHAGEDHILDYQVSRRWTTLFDPTDRTHYIIYHTTGLMVWINQFDEGFSTHPKKYSIEASQIIIDPNRLKGTLPWKN